MLTRTPDTSTLIANDGNATFYCLKGIPTSFKQISLKLFEMTSKGPDIVFSTDSYLPDSIKSMERARRGSPPKLIIKGENTRRSANWTKFQKNDENKQQFIEVILKVWSSDLVGAKLLNRKIVMICSEKAFLLAFEDSKRTVKTEVESLNSTQEETDSRVILYCFYAKEQGYRHVRVKSPDTDIFFICLHYAKILDRIQIIFDTARGNKKQLVNITSWQTSTLSNTV